MTLVKSLYTTSAVDDYLPTFFSPFLCVFPSIFSILIPFQETSEGDREPGRLRSRQCGPGQLCVKPDFMPTDSWELFIPSSRKSRFQSSFFVEGTNET
jgi:hypothetical protein